MKILIITNHSFMLYRFRKELIQSLMKEHEVVLSMPFVGHETDFMEMGIRCIDTNMQRREIHVTDEVKLFTTYLSQILKERPDLVITYSIKPNIYAGLVCRLLGVPYCANVQGLGTAFQMEKFQRAVVMLYKQALRKVKMTFFENQDNADIFLTKGILPGEKRTILNGAGINLADYALTPYPDNDDFHFLYLGRIMREKGIYELFSSIKKLHQKYGSKVKLDIVGFFDYEDFNAPIQELVDMGIATFHGFQTDPRPYYVQTDCVIVPSYHEGMSNVLLEAASMGRPLITTSIPGCQEAVIPEISGFLCKPKDEESLYLCMERMLLLSRERRAAMGAAGREKMEQEFDRNKIVTQIIQKLNLPSEEAVC